MAFEINQEAARSFRSDKRLYLTADDKVVEEGHPDANTLLVAAGGLVTKDEADKYGLDVSDATAPKAEEPAADEAQAADAEAATAKPAAKKAATKAPAGKAKK